MLITMRTTFSDSQSSSQRNSSSGTRFNIREYMMLQQAILYGIPSGAYLSISPDWEIRKGSFHDLIEGRIHML